MGISLQMQGVRPLRDNPNMSAWSGGYSDGPEASAALLCARAAVPLHRARHCLVTGGGDREGRTRPSRTLPPPRPGGSAQVIDNDYIEV